MKNLKNCLLVVLMANLPIAFCVESNTIHGIKDLNHLEKNRLINANLSQDEIYLIAKKEIGNLTSILREMKENQDPKYDAVRKEETKERLKYAIELKKYCLLKAKRTIPFRLLNMNEILELDKQRLELDKQREEEIEFFPEYAKLLRDHLDKISPILDNQTKEILEIQSYIDEHITGKNNIFDFERDKADSESIRDRIEKLEEEFEKENQARINRINRINRMKTENATDFSYIKPYIIVGSFIILFCFFYNYKKTKKYNKC